jgi:hypothetical protein
MSNYDNKFFEGRLKNNNELNLYNINLNDNNCKNLNDYLKNKNNLSKINFIGKNTFYNKIACGISNEGIKYLKEGLLKNTSLIELSLYCKINN